MKQLLKYLKTYVFWSFLKTGLLFFKNWTARALYTLKKLALCLLYGLQTFPTLCLSPLKCLNIFHNKKHACSLSIFSFMLSEFCDLLGRDFALDYKMISSCFFCFFNFFKFYFTILYWFCHTSTWIHHGWTWVPNPEPICSFISF